MYWYNPNMEDGEVVYNNIYSSECIYSCVYKYLVLACTMSVVGLQTN